MKRVLLVTALLLSGCSLADSASKDAEKALSDNDYRLYKLAVRGLVLPGIPSNERGNAVVLCGTRILKGTGDVLRGNKDRNARRQLVEYASEYNKIVYERCQQNLRNNSLN